jgi:hypothetical protein
MKSIGRRTFFNKISMTAIGTMLLSFFPLNLFANNKKKIASKIQVKLHPNSVRRNK